MRKTIERGKPLAGDEVLKISGGSGHGKCGFSKEVQ